MIYDFDCHVERRATDSVKWQHYGPDVLPLWVADMDFRSPEPVIEALHRRVAHGILGYGTEPPGLRDVVVERLARLYGWRVGPEALLFVPGVVAGFNWACRQLADPGDGVLVQTPVYPPMLTGHTHLGLSRQEMELTRGPEGRYTVNMEAFEAALRPETRLFMLCNPHNPVGRVFSRAELSDMAEACLRHVITIISDEIHCDLIFPGHRHQPIAAIDPSIAQHTVTLMAPSKTYNIAGLHSSVVIAENPALRARLERGLHELMGGVNILGLVAALAAYRDGQTWLDEALAYLTGNRDFLAQYVREQLPGLAMGVPEATYLAWLDCRQSQIPGDPFRFFLDEARVALNDGASFGQGGKGFVRLNFGCTRAVLSEALDRMREALQKVDHQ